MGENEEFHVVLADDHEIFRKGLEVTLRRISFVGKISHASNGRQVLDVMEGSDPVHVIMMDIRMPHMDGIETTRQVRLKSSTVKILALSMMDDKATILQMFRAGANGYLLKNTNRLELAEAIRNVMDGNLYYAREVSQMLLKRELDQFPKPRTTKFNTDLTAREIEILRLICHQYSTKEIADVLFLAEKTVEGHRKNLLEKTRSRNIAGLVYYALENGIIKKGG